MKGKDNKVIIGITGGVATGKTLVSGEFRKRGASIIDADRIAREILHKGTPGFRRVVKRFGRDILLPSGVINRRKLRDIIFRNKRERKTLEHITHPEIIKRIKDAIYSIRKGTVVINAPLLFEAKIHFLMDWIIVVWSSQKMQIKRLAERDGVTRSEALKMIHAQMPLKEKKKRADFVLRNTGSIRDVKSDVRKIYKKIAPWKK